MLDNFKPFSDKIIFLDTEFSSLDPYKGEVLSVGMVKPSGEEFYIELEFSGEVDPWVKEHVMPFLNGEKVSRAEADRLMREFIGPDSPYLLGYVENYDAVYLAKLFGADNTPFYWLPLDLASMFFAHGLDPQTFGHGGENGFYEQLGIDWKKYREHHALDDAKLLREAYLKLIEKK